ncbi:MAG: endonuclease/exonuclease/phosphatase family protein, partial [Blastopirellula sp. JB062]
MSRVILAFTFALACVFCRGVTAVEPLRILSYNIHHAEGLDDKLDLPRIAEVIKSVSPDFVFLQEVDRRVLRSGQVDQATELGKLTGLHSAFGGNIRLGAGDYGNAILSRFPLRELKNHPLPN